MHEGLVSLQFIDVWSKRVHAKDFCVHLRQEKEYEGEKYKKDKRRGEWKIKNAAYPSDYRIMGSKKISMLSNIHVNLWRRFQGLDERFPLISIFPLNPHTNSNRAIQLSIGYQRGSEQVKLHCIIRHGTQIRRINRDSSDRIVIIKRVERSYV